MKKIFFLFLLIGLTSVSNAQKNKTLGNSIMTFKKGTVLTEVVEPNNHPIVVDSKRSENLYPQKNITLLWETTRITFRVSNAQYNLLMEALEIGPIKVTLNSQGEMDGYSEITGK